jgi:hypothetical protein
MDEDKDDTIRRILKKARKAEHVEYPEHLLQKRREGFIRWIFSRRFGCLIFWIIILAIALVWVLNNLEYVYAVLHLLSS